MPPASRLHLLLKQGASLDTALATLREQGHSIIDAIKAVREVEGVSLGKAKNLVSVSPAWADVHESNGPLQEALIASLEGSRDNVGDARESGDTSV